MAKKNSSKKTKTKTIRKANKKIRKKTTKNVTKKKISKKTTRKIAKKTPKTIINKIIKASTAKKDKTNNDDGAIPTATLNISKKRFAGIFLGGSKNERTSFAVLEYFPKYKKVFLKVLHDKLPLKKDISSDTQLISLIEKTEKPIHLLAMNTPIVLPKCLRCNLKCPGQEKCKQPEIKWLWDYHNKKAKSKRPNKIFAPYTQRCAEVYLANELEEPFFPSDALGSNMAPLTVRTQFLLKRLKANIIEFNPKVSVWRVGRSLNIQKSYLRFYRHSLESAEGRQYVLQELIKRDIAFIYSQDLKLLVDNPNCFDAFFGALTAYLKYKKQVEGIPKGFPKNEGWIEVPKKTIIFD